MNRLQDSEDRNDKFLQELLLRSEKLEVNKVNVESYDADTAKLNKRLAQYDKDTRENHTHYIQVENYVEKFLPLKIQKQIGKNLLIVLGQKKSLFDKYKEYEQSFLRVQNQVILQDEGIPSIMKDLQKEFFHMLQGALQMKVPPEMGANTVNLGRSNLNEEKKGSKDGSSAHEEEKVGAFTEEGKPIMISLKDYLLEPYGAGQMMPELDDEKPIICSCTRSAP